MDCSISSLVKASMACITGRAWQQANSASPAALYLHKAALTTLPDLKTGVKEVFGYTDCLAHPPEELEVEDTATAILKMHSGTLCTLLGATSMYPGLERRIVLSGRNGTIELVGSKITQWQFRDKSPEDEAIRAHYAAPKDERGQGGAANPLEISITDLERNILNFVNALRGEETLNITGPDAREAVHIIEAVYQSNSQKRPIVF